MTISHEYRVIQKDKFGNYDLIITDKDNNESVILNELQVKNLYSTYLQLVNFKEMNSHVK